ncbi:MAG: FKBP-type peptidyl-prolyl cis-trans isomerase [Bacilli bacterium]|jgi:FKBP-type peptidyl-prolyl cis-trans isomerase (trigger factor)|nr:FKBP-type peptidyl-prolyl cis-trans isomerase [Bacilli bacterium]
MKKINTLIFILVISILLVGCGSKDTYKLKGDYSQCQPYMDNIIKQGQINFSTTETNQPSKNNDVVWIDYTGYVNNKTFDGGTAKNQPLLLGSNTFIDNFEEQLLNHKAGDSVDVNVTFPSNYSVTSLAGKKALFKVKINKVSSLISVDQLIAILKKQAPDQYKEVTTTNDLKNYLCDLMLTQQDTSSQDTTSK